MERCEPGTPLSAVAPDAALDVLIGLLPRLWKPAGAPFHTLADEAAWWAGYLPREWEANGRPFERRLLDAAVDALEDLAPTQGEQVLLHQDLHGDNVLAAAREPWLVIDPKPLAGEREFAVAPIVRSTELGHSRREVLHRLDRLTSELGLDRDRARGWTIGQTIAWATDDDPPEEHLDVVRWLLEAG
jgi:streptomycin 6-kinase